MMAMMMNHGYDDKLIRMTMVVIDDDDEKDSLDNVKDR